MEECPTCGDLFPKRIDGRKISLKRHMYYHRLNVFSDNPMIRCDYNSCLKTFVSQEKYEKHIYENHLFICSHCLLTFTAREILDQHLKSSHNGGATEDAAMVDL